MEQKSEYDEQSTNASSLWTYKEPAHHSMMKPKHAKNKKRMVIREFEVPPAPSFEELKKDLMNDNSQSKLEHREDKTKADMKLPKMIADDAL